MIFQHEEHESEAAEYLCMYLDPLMLIYASIGVVLFFFFAYKKPELRIFLISIVSLWFSIIFLFFENSYGEAIFLMISGLSSIPAILFYKYKISINID
ncbi:MAG: hypothetical protein ACFFAO_13805 [Candidatus Hermodarchaeota archaeon]